MASEKQNSLRFKQLEKQVRKVLSLPVSGNSTKSGKIVLREGPYQENSIAIPFLEVFDLCLLPKSSGDLVQPHLARKRIELGKAYIFSRTRCRLWTACHSRRLRLPSHQSRCVEAAECLPPPP